MTTSDVLDRRAMLTMVGYDDCIIGVCTRFGQEPIVAYDRAKVIAKLMAEGLTEEDAEEWFQFNQIGGWYGEMTPCFIELTDTIEELIK